MTNATLISPDLTAHIAATFPALAGTFDTFADADVTANALTTFISDTTVFGIDEIDFAVRMHLVA